MSTTVTPQTWMYDADGDLMKPDLQLKAELCLTDAQWADWWTVNDQETARRASGRGGTRFIGSGDPQQARWVEAVDALVGIGRIDAGDRSAALRSEWVKYAGCPGCGSSGAFLRRDAAGKFDKGQVRASCGRRCRTRDVLGELGIETLPDVHDLVEGYVSELVAKDAHAGGTNMTPAGVRDLTPEPAVDTETGEVSEDAAERARRLFPRIDWHELWADESEEEWIHKPLLPARRLVALYSPPKVGKSLLMLEMAVCLSRGERFLGHLPERRFRMLYVDFENDPRGDVRERLQAMAYGPGDLDHLDYLTFPSMAALDTERGGAELVEAVRAYGSDAVVIDTVSRTIAGEENDNDTWLNFYRHTGLPLKRLEVALIRLDHSGKDETRGMRGGSAKSGDVDAVWRLSKVTEQRFRLECTDSRMPVDIKMLHIARRFEPLHHVADNLPADDEHEQKVADIIRLCDEAKLPGDAGRDAIRDLVKGHGIKARNVVLSDVAKRRKAVPDARGQVDEDDCPEARGTGSGPDAWISRNDGDSGCPQTSGTGPGQVGTASVPVSVPHVVGTGQAGPGTACAVGGCEELISENRQKHGKHTCAMHALEEKHFQGEQP